MTTLSLCMIVKNEAKSLPRCLASVAQVVDQTVVVDTGSTDQTREVAQDLGAEVHTFAWDNDFAAARNQSLKYAQGDWVLVLDGDEVLVPEIIPRLRQAIENHAYLLINLVRQEVGAAQSPYSLVSRLFRRHPEISFSRPYHAIVDERVAEIINHDPDWQVGYLPEVAIAHYGYHPEAIARGDKFSRAQTTMETFLANHPGDPYVCSKLGALYVQQGEQRGMLLLEQGLEAENIEPPVLYELYYHLGIAYARLGKLSSAEAHYRTALQQQIPLRLQLGAYNNLGSLLKAQGDLLAAKKLFQTVLDIDPGFAVGHYNLGMTLKALGALKAAIAAYERAIQLNPDYAEAYQNLGVVLLKLGQVPESLKLLRRAISLHGQQNPPEAERLRQGVKALGFEL